MASLYKTYKEKGSQVGWVIFYNQGCHEISTTKRIWVGFKYLLGTLTQYVSQILWLSSFKKSIATIMSVPCTTMVSVSFTVKVTLKWDGPLIINGMATLAGCYS